FVVGALVSAVLTLSDRWSARRLVSGCALIAGLATVGVALASGPTVGLTLRMLTGAALAGVYPPGMKIAAGWYREGRGLAIGVLVGALTLGSALPHLVRWAVPAEHWRPVLVIAAAAAVVGGLLVLLVPHDGPFAAAAPPFSWRAAPRILADHAVSLANLGYLGHMWELYAMWTWLAAFVAASELARTGGDPAAGGARARALGWCVGDAGPAAPARGGRTRRWARLGHGDDSHFATELVGHARRPPRRSPAPTVDPHVDPVHAARHGEQAFPRALARAAERNRPPVREITRHVDCRRC